MRKFETGSLNTVMVFEMVALSPALKIVNLIVNTPGELNIAPGLQSSDVFPFTPKFQKQLSGLPNDVFLKLTYKGAQPLSLLGIKLGTNCALHIDPFKNIKQHVSARYNNLLLDTKCLTGA